jgi:5'-3' exonuclease
MSSMYPFKRMVIDADLWTYDVAFAAERKDLTLPFSYCIDLIDTRLHELKETLHCDEFTMYLTGSGNFRHDIAKADVYKGNRNQPRPKYYQNIRDYLVVQYNAQVINGMEADDALAMELTEHGEGVICVSRDKDLRQVPGWHYSYSVGNQLPFGPHKYDYLGELNLFKMKSGNKITGGGLKFFYSQVLTGDTVDNYKGIKGTGPVTTYKLLSDCESDYELLRVSLQEYHRKHAENAAEAFLEQADLAWMVREVREDGSPVLYSDWLRDEVHDILEGMNGQDGNDG